MEPEERVGGGRKNGVWTHLGGSAPQDREAALAMHGLSRRLGGSPFVPEPEFTRLQEVLVPAEAGTLIPYPAGREARRTV